jgi:hypothetical protein
MQHLPLINGRMFHEFKKRSYEELDQHLVDCYLQTPSYIIDKKSMKATKMIDCCLQTPS